MTPQFTLYGNIASITSERVRLMLADQDFTDYQFVSLDFLKGEHKQPPYLTRHPWGRVPAIVLSNGSHVYESLAICSYLALTYNFPLLPNPKSSTPLERALFDQAVSAEESYFFPAASRISSQKAGTLLGGQPDDTVVAEARKELASHFAILDRLLARQNGGFMGGSEWGLVDIYYIPVVQRLIDIGGTEAIFGENGEQRGNVQVKEWWQRCLEREKVKTFVGEMLSLDEIRKRIEARKKSEAATAAKKDDRL